MSPHKKGFSLIEIMVALALGMLATIVIMQVFQLSEGRKRTTTSGSDAQTNGALAIYTIERDVKMAGFGLDTSSYSSCTSAFTYCDGTAACGGSGTAGPLSSFTFASIKIADGGTGPDTITSQFFANPNTDTFRFPANTTISNTMPQSSSELDVSSVSGCAIGGMVIVSQGNQCTLMEITQVQGTALKIQHNPGSSGPYNPPASYQNANGWPAYTQGATVACFGAASNAPVFQKSYYINTTSHLLLLDDNTVTPAVTSRVVASEIIDMQAEYGVAPSGSQTVSSWVPATGTWANPTVTDWKRIKAVRIALVARSSQYEKPVSGACTTTTSTTGWSSWATFDTSNYPADWKCYRYKAYETVVPLRNILWGNL
jgi:type IV pilus assembly protein PilW